MICHGGFFSAVRNYGKTGYSALVIFPERMQRVQTLTLRTVPLFMAFIFWRFGCQVRRVLLLA